MEQDVLNEIYSLNTEYRDDYMNPTAKRSMSLRRIQPFDSDLQDSWVIKTIGAMSSCPRTAIVKIVRQISVELCHTPTYDGTNYLDTFLRDMESMVEEQYCMDVLDTTLRGTPIRWKEMKNMILLLWKQPICAH